MLHDVYRLEFHGPLFHGGKNFGTKVEAASIQGLQIQYDDEKRWFVVNYKNTASVDPRIAIVPELSVFMWEPMASAPKKQVVNQHTTHDVTKIQNAQVETPMGHVFAGEGKGKTKR